MPEIQITRLNPKTGLTEVPARQNGHFILGDPAFGADKKLARHAVLVTSLEEVAALVRRGYHVRMTDGVRRPGLISPGKIQITIDGRVA